VCVPFRLVGRAVCESADTGILLVDKVNEIRVAIMKARGERLVLDHTIQFDYESVSPEDNSSHTRDTPSGIPRFHAIVYLGRRQPGVCPVCTQ
jgi:hypothetical protein